MKGNKNIKINSIDYFNSLTSSSLEFLFPSIEDPKMQKSLYYATMSFINKYQPSK